MAGASSRFFNEGYKKPKYQLQAHGHSLFYYSIISFKKYFNKEFFLFICLEEQRSKEFIKSECDSLNIKNFKIIELEKISEGQADTVYQGLKKVNFIEQDRLLIFNIDTFRWRYEFPDFIYNSYWSGYLETFIGSGSNWSNIIPNPKNKSQVKKTSEKLNESKYCSTGLYYFNEINDFLYAFNKEKEESQLRNVKSELYIAPIYNHLISNNKKITFTVIEKDEVVFCGVPGEYKDFLEQDPERIISLI